MNTVETALDTRQNASLLVEGSGGAAARNRIAFTYCWRHGRFPNLREPALFTELVQRRKLTDRNMMMPRMADKVLVKELVAQQIGDSWIIPTLWHGRDLPSQPKWPLPLVVKSRHGCNQRAFVRRSDAEWPAIRKRAAGWTNSTYGRWLDEWLYTKIEPGILVEPFVGIDGQLPVDYKLYVFGGRVEYVQVHIDRERHHRWLVLDRQWRRVSSATPDADPPMPKSFPAMIEAAETLGKAFDFVRADFYDIAGKPLFGELTFYPGSGLDRFDPIALDITMGAYWLAAKRAC